MTEKQDRSKPEVSADERMIFVAQPNVSKYVKEKSGFLEWTQKERMRLARQWTPKLEFDKEYEDFKLEEQARRQALLELGQEAEKEKRARKHHFPNPPPPHVLSAVKIKRRLFYYVYHELSPFRTLVYHEAPAATSNLIYPCPDMEYWGAWFGNDEVTLSQHCRYWFPPCGRCTGKFKVFVDLSLPWGGLVDIGHGGSVQVEAACYVSLVQCDAEDKNHDYGWHYDPRYDTYLGDWRSYCDGGFPLYYVDTEEGLHTFNPDLDISVSLLSSICTTLNRFLEITQDITIKAENAVAQFGPSSWDCAAGVGRGWIHTPYPVVGLEYFAPESFETLPPGM